MPAREVTAAVGRRLAAIGREQPDVVAVAVVRQPAAERGDRLAVGQPGGDEEDRLRPVRDPGPLAGGDIDDDDLGPEGEVVVAPRASREGDPRAVGRPGGILVAGRPVGQAGRLAGRDVDDPEVRDLVVDEARPVEHVAEPVDVAVVRLGRVGRLALPVQAAGLPVVLPVGSVGRRGHDELRAVGRPLEAADPARQVGQASRLAAVEGEQVDLRAVLAVLLVGRVGLLLDDVPPVREERDRPAVRRPARARVVLRPERQLARLAAAGIERHDPQRVAVAVALRRGRLEGHDRPGAVGRDARVGRDAELVEVVGGERSRHVDPPVGARRAAGRGDAAESTGYHRDTMRDQLSLRLEPDVPVLPNLPATLRPMLPRPLAEPFDSDAHLFEPSWGGLRALAFIGPAEVAGGGRRAVRRRRGRTLAACRSWPGLAVRVDARSAVLDGELVVVGANGLADAEELARRLAGERGRPVAYLAFDLLHLDGRSLLSAPLTRRRETLRRVLRPGDEVVAVPAIAGEGRALHEAAAAQGIAGIMARQRTSPYLPGIKSRLWRFVPTLAGRSGGRPERRPSWSSRARWAASSAPSIAPIRLPLLFERIAGRLIPGDRGAEGRGRGPLATAGTPGRRGTSRRVTTAGQPPRTLAAPAAGRRAARPRRRSGSRSRS